MTVKIICFGDSNTYGYDPRSYLGDRYPMDSRWVDILSYISGCETINYGMNGREIPLRASFSLPPADILIVMLGTNDLLQGCGAETVSVRMSNFLNSLSFERSKIVLVAPPPMIYGEWVTEQYLIDESKQLSRYYRICAERNYVHYADAGEWNISLAYDGVHFSEAGHKAFAKGLVGFLTHKGLL